MTVNGQEVTATVPVRRLLLDFIREDLKLTGAHAGCEHGVCGACTVSVDGEPVRSCLMLTATAHGADVKTVEGLAGEGNLVAMQRAFRDCHAYQCGYCTSGFLMTLESADPDDYPDDESIRHLLSGNMCRCTGYQNIVHAVNRAWGRDQGSA